MKSLLTVMNFFYINSAFKQASSKSMVKTLDSCVECVAINSAATVLPVHFFDWFIGKKTFGKWLPDKKHTVSSITGTIASSSYLGRLLTNSEKD